MVLRKFLLIIFVFIFLGGNAQSRKIINIPNINNYKTLKCDFHMHTVFSDGTVWPTVRVQEAWEEGLDAISITEHIEYRPHAKDLIADHNRSYEIAKPLAKQMNIILVQGAEITRSMPSRHFNALFIKNANLLDRKDVNDAIKEAHDQGAFIFCNHLGWKAQQLDSTLWWEAHTKLFKNSLINGIEVVGNKSFYPKALNWANENKLTMLANSNVHGPMKVEEGHRPLTLVFAKSRTKGGIKEALFSKRTVIYFQNKLMGKSNLLEPLFFASLDYSNKPLRINKGTENAIYIKNNSDIDYELELLQPGVGFDAPEQITLKAHQLTQLRLSGNSEQVNTMHNLNAYYQVKNMLTDEKENLVVTFTFRNN